MEKIKALLVDDEPPALKALELLLEKHVLEVDVIGKEENIQDAFSFIVKRKPDLVFLDISMPTGSGLELLERIKAYNVKVIFTTAYEEHAIEALRLSALDYLLKPIDKTELKSAINRFFELKFHPQPKVEEDKKITISTLEGMIILNFQDIYYIHSDKNYSIFQTKTESFLSSKSLGYYEQILQKSFLRIHRSHIVNIDQIMQVKKGKTCHVILNNGIALEVSKTKKEELIDKLS